MNIDNSEEEEKRTPWRGKRTCFNYTGARETSVKLFTQTNPLAIV